MYDFLFRIIVLFSLALTVEALQGKTCQDSLLSGEGRSLGAKISGGRGRPWGLFFGFYKTRHILLSDSANCIVPRAVVLAQYRRVTDGIAVASKALAMRRAVKNDTRVHGPCWSPQVLTRSVFTGVQNDARVHDP